VESDRGRPGGKGTGGGAADAGCPFTVVRGCGFSRATAGFGLARGVELAAGGGAAGGAAVVWAADCAALWLPPRVASTTTRATATTSVVAMLRTVRVLSRLRIV
jgi:hypothetical protein